jgi:WD40 repeat protein
VGTPSGKGLFLFQGYAGDVTGLAFSPDGKRIARSSKVCSAQTGEEFLTLKGDGAALSPDGHGLAAGATDGTLTTWDATPLPAKP